MIIKDKIVKEEINTDEDLEIYQDTAFEKNIKCNNIISKNEKWDINAKDINAWDINAKDINARDINARDINARDIIIEKRIKKKEYSKTIARIFIKDKSKLERQEW